MPLTLAQTRLLGYFAPAPGRSARVLIPLHRECSARDSLLWLPPTELRGARSRKPEILDLDNTFRAPNGGQQTCILERASRRARLRVDASISGKRYAGCGDPAPGAAPKDREAAVIKFLVVHGKTGLRTASLNPSTTSSITAATPTLKIMSLPTAIEQSPVTHCEAWYDFTSMSDAPSDYKDANIAFRPVGHYGVAMQPKALCDLFGALLFLSLLIWLGLRITQGVDLSDESYYAIFLTTWLMEGIDTSPFLTLHQTAALLVYPAAVLFQRATGSTEGLILFLRALYVIGTLIAALTVIALFRRAGMRLGGWVAGALVLAFIPFGLPAPSYNTIGEHAAIAALASCGCALLERDAPWRAQVFWFTFSGMAWTIATVAYPSLVIALVLLFIYLFFVLRLNRPALIMYAVLVLTFQILAWLIVIEVLTLPRIRDSVIYQASIAGSLEVDKKISLAAHIVSQNIWFCLAAVVAILIGAFRAYFKAPITSAVVTSLIVVILVTPPTLLLRSHDAVLLGALTGLAILFVVWQRQRSSAARVLALIYSVSLAAGAITATTTTWPLFAFPIGGFFSAIIAILWEPSERAETWGLLPGAALLGLLVWCSASFYYGELPSERRQKRELIGEGVYAGLAASEETAQLIRIAKAALDKWLRPNEGITVVGRFPGLYLLTTARPHTLLPFPLTAFAQASGLSATYEYYANPANRPNIVVIYEDPYFQPINPFGSRFVEWYRPVARERTPLGTMSIFSRKL